MSEKRRDNKGRILKDGESQRPNGTYMYRFTDGRGKRGCVYAKTLEELRTKEKDVSLEVARGLTYEGRSITVEGLLDILMEQKKNVRDNTKRTYQCHIKKVKSTPFAKLKAVSVKMSAAKAFVLELEEAGYGFSAIKAVAGLLKAAFDIACEDDVIFRNPFDFSIVKLVSVRQGKRQALTAAQQEQLLAFIANHPQYADYLDEVQILLGTGIRMGELCGLTEDNFDMKHRRLFIEKQTYIGKGGDRHFVPLKTESSERIIPMSDSVYLAARRVLKRSQESPERVPVDGRTDYVFFSKNLLPRVTVRYTKMFQRMSVAFEKATGNKVTLSPHVFRHTFCSNMVRDGMDVKNLQYLMGHATADVTINTYAHTSYEAAEAAFRRCCGE